MPRSGTNFLSNLLCLHPDCAAPAPILEDYTLHHADLLVRYGESVRQRWRPDWGVTEDLDGLLCQSLGNGVMEFLSLRIGGRRLVTKTPSVRNLTTFFRLFPDQCLLILVRDGRDVVESLVKSFGVNPEWAMRRWADAARAIVDFDGTSNHAGHRYLIVRYEDLWHNLRSELHRIFAFLELRADAYDFEAAANLPVRGSSVLHSQANQTVHWNPVEKPADFDPIGRWRNWHPRQQERFDWIAGAYLAPLGYDHQPGGTHPLWSVVWNRLSDIRWLAGSIVRAIADRRKKANLSSAHGSW